MSRRAAAAAALALAAALAPAGAGAAPDGAAVFAGKGGCASCHGDDASGTRMAPDLTDGEWLHGDGSYESIAALVRRGVPEPAEAPAPMPPFEGVLDDEEIAAVARYVHDLSR